MHIVYMLRKAGQTAGPIGLKFVVYTLGCSGGIMNKKFYNLTFDAILYKFQSNIRYNIRNDILTLDIKFNIDILSNNTFKL